MTSCQVMITRWVGVVLVAAGAVVHDAPAVRSATDPGDPIARIAASYRLAPVGKPVARLVEEPAIRWTKPAGEIEDATLFFWTSDGRPIAAGTFLRQKNVGMYHEFQSLTVRPLRAERDGRAVWDCAQPGIVFAPVPGAPVPAGTTGKRQIQLKTLADEFRAEAVKEPPFYGKHSVYKFRLLPRPLLRYGDRDRPECEGAIFAFVQDTDPEVLLVVESRPQGKQVRWEYALAPMTGWQLKAWHKDVEVWSIKNRHPGHDPAEPYFVAGPFPADDAPRNE